MAAEVLQWGGFIDGDLTLVDSPDAYVGGQPAAIGATGLNLCKAGVNEANYVGLFKNDSQDDLAIGPQVDDTLLPGDKDCAIIAGANKVRLSPSVISGVSTTPFVFPGTGGGGWAVNDELFITAAGLWDNADVGSGLRYGKVVKAPASATDDLHFYQYPLGVIS